MHFFFLGLGLVASTLAAPAGLSNAGPVVNVFNGAQSSPPVTVTAGPPPPDSGPINTITPEPTTVTLAPATVVIASQNSFFVRSTVTVSQVGPDGSKAASSPRSTVTVQPTVTLSTPVVSLSAMPPTTVTVAASQPAPPVQSTVTVPPSQPAPTPPQSTVTVPPSQPAPPAPPAPSTVTVPPPTVTVNPPDQKTSHTTSSSPSVSKSIIYITPKVTVNKPSPTPPAKTDKPKDDKAKASPCVSKPIQHPKTATQI